MKLKEKETKLHLLFNNSGMSWGGLLDDFDEVSGWDRLFSLNVKSLFYLTVELLDLLERGSLGNNDPSRVINISSVASIISFAETPLAKAGSGFITLTRDMVL
jgi:NAD(P)-dependent dehydrogenase (short-subunit alcohol dehydrogenase family)